MVSGQKKFIFNQEKYKNIKRENQYLLISNELFKVLYLNETAKEIVNMLDGNTNIDDIIKKLTDLYAIPEADVREYVVKFIENLEEEELIYEIGTRPYQSVKLNDKLDKIYLTCAKIAQSGIVEKIQLASFNTLLEGLDCYISQGGAAIFIRGLELLDINEIDYILGKLNETNVRVYLYLFEKSLPEKILLDYKHVIRAAIFPIIHTDSKINDENLYLGHYSFFAQESKRCKYYNIPTYISVMPIEKNLNNLIQLYQFAYDEKLQGIFIENNLELKNGHQYRAYENIKMELIRKNNFYDSWRNNRLKTKSVFNLVFDEDRCSNGTNSIAPKYHCGSGVNIIYVDQNTDIYPCHMLRQKQMCIGKINAYPKQRKAFMDRKCVEKCKKCDYWIFCLGGCPAENLLNNEALEDINTHCQRRKDFYEEKFKKLF